MFVSEAKLQTKALHQPEAVPQGELLQLMCRFAQNEIPAAIELTESFASSICGILGFFLL